jgi:hypothetical protein
MLPHPNRGQSNSKGWWANTGSRLEARARQPYTRESISGAGHRAILGSSEVGKITTKRYEKVAGTL